MVRLFVYGDIMLITVIVPYKNAAPYIGRCIDSLKNQRGGFEFILVNDNSSDRSKYEALWRTEKDTRFKVIDNQRSPGVSGARNTGMDIAVGDWITFLDADDILLPDAYKKFETVIKADPKADMHQFNHYRNYKAKHFRVLKYANCAGRFTIKNPPMWWFGVWNKLFYSKFIQDIRFDESLQYGEDGLFVLECYSKGAYIHHGARSVTTVEHILENKKSLSHVKTCGDVLKQIRAYLNFLEIQSDPDLRLFMCNEIARLLQAPHIQKVVCDAEV